MHERECFYVYAKSTYMYLMCISYVRIGRIDVEGDTLRLKASRTEKVGEEEKSYTYARTYTLPDDVNHEQLTASFEDGLLTVKLPKEAAKQPLKIAVK